MQGRCGVFPLHPRLKIPQSLAMSSVRLSCTEERGRRSDISIRVFFFLNFPLVERSILNSFS